MAVRLNSAVTTWGMNSQHLSSHPLHARLAGPLPPIYPEPVTAVAWNDDAPLSEAEGVVYILTKPSRQGSAWARDLLKILRRDRSYETDDIYSRLSGAPITAVQMNRIGTVRVELTGARGQPVRAAQASCRIFVSVPLLAVVLRQVQGEAVGFASFDIKWSVGASYDPNDPIELEIEPGQVWITPEFRGRRWGELAAIAIAMTTGEHVAQTEASTRWPRGFKAPLSVTVGADVYSRSGESFLRCCAEYVSMELDFRTDLQHFSLDQVSFEPRW